MTFRLGTLGIQIELGITSGTLRHLGLRFLLPNPVAGGVARNVAQVALGSNAFKQENGKGIT